MEGRLSPGHLFLDSFTPNNFLDLPARLFSPVHSHGGRVLLFLTLGRVRIQTLVFWLPIPFSKGTCHIQHACILALAPASQTYPQQT